MAALASEPWRDVATPWGWTHRRTVTLVLAIWIVSRTTLFAISLTALGTRAYGHDVDIYAVTAGRMLVGDLPYSDFGSEYPPGSMPFFLIPALVGGTGAGYHLAFALEMLIVDAVGLYAAWRLARAVDRSRYRIPLAYTIGLTITGPLLLTRFDLVSAVCVLLAAAFAAEWRIGPAAAALGYGAAVKIFPGFLALLVVLGLTPTLGWWRSLKRTVPAFLAAFLALVLPALTVSVRGTLDSVRYHIDRGVQIESLWANALGLAHMLNDFPARSTFAFGSFQLDSSWSALIQTLSGLATLAACVAATLIVWVRAVRSGGLDQCDWAPAFAVGIFALILPSRVLSPQYFLWLMAPIAVMVHWPAGRRAFLALATTLIVSHLIYPLRYENLIRLEAVDICLLTLRNVLLILTAWLATRAFWRGCRSALEV